MAMEPEFTEDEGPLQSRIDSVLWCIDNAQSEWALIYWNNVLSYLLRKLNRCGPQNYHLN